MDTRRETNVGVEPPTSNDKALHLEEQAAETRKKSAEGVAEVQELKN